MTKDNTIRVSLVEDDDEIRVALAILIQATEGMTCHSKFGDCESAIKSVSKDPPDVLMMDIELPGMSGVEGVQKIKAAQPGIDIIMLTIHKDDDLVFQSLSLGATGYMLKDSQPDDILRAIRDVRNGGSPMSSQIARRIVVSFRKAEESPLTKRETEVLEKLCEGHSYKMIGADLFVSEETIHFHIKNIYQKLQVHSKSEAVAKAFRDRLI